MGDLDRSFSFHTPRRAKYPGIRTRNAKSNKSLTPVRLPQLNSSRSRVMTHHTFIEEFDDDSFNGRSKSGFDFNEKEFAHQEKSEVSSLLRKLRRKYDELKRTNDMREVELKRTHHNLGDFNQAEDQREWDSVMIDDTSAKFKKRTTQTRSKTEQELSLRATYMHMLERMKQDKLVLQMKITEKRQEVRQKNIMAEEQRKLSLKYREERTQTQEALNGLMKAIDRDQKKRREHLGAMKRTIVAKHDANVVRDARHRRHMAIAEAAANEENENGEQKLRSAFLIQKFMTSLLRVKMQKEMESHAHLEEYVKKIRDATGIVNIDEITYKFFNKEQICNQLVASVAESEERIEKARLKNKELRKRLEAVKVNQEDDISVKKDEISEKIEDLNHDISRAFKSREVVQEKVDKGFVVYRQLTDWISRIWRKVRVNLLKDNDAVLVDSTNTAASSNGAGGEKKIRRGSVLPQLTDEQLEQFYTNIVEAVCEQLQKIKSDQLKIEEFPFSAGDVVADTSFHDYSAKNIRIKAKNQLRRADSGSLSDRKSTGTSRYTEPSDDDEDDDFYHQENDDLFRGQRKDMKHLKLRHK